jgi:phosphopantetheinyl transferase (holo-ACP synthase)
MNLKMEDYGSRIAIYIESDGSDKPELKLISRDAERYEETKREMGIQTERLDEDHPAVEAIEQAFNSFYNHGATNGELQWVSRGSENNFIARFWSNKSKTLKAMIEAALRRLIQSDSKRFKGVKGGAMTEARKVATKAFEAIEKGYRPSPIEEPEPYKVAV